MPTPAYMTSGVDASLARLVKDGAIFIREAGTADIPTSEIWTPTNAASQIGYYSEEGFTLTPSPGDTTELVGHNGDPLINEQAPGYWTIAFAGLEGNETTAETYFDVEAGVDGSITVTTAAANKRYDIVTVGLDQNDRLILVHYPNVQISERQGITFNRTSLLAMGATFRTFKGGAGAPYHFKAWGMVSGAIPTKDTAWSIAVTGTPTGGTFSLAVDGFSTAGIAYGADSTAVQAAVNALSGVTGVTATVSGTTTKTFAFTSAVNLTANGSALTGGTDPGVTVTQL